MIEAIIDNAPGFLALLAMPAYFLLFLCRDVVKLKLNLIKGKKKGTKFVVGISADKTVRISAETPKNKNKFVFSNDQGHTQDVSINPDDLMFAPQFGTQCALVTQGSKKIFNPFSSDLYDPVDGDYMAIALAKAEAVGRYGLGWGATKEQKLLIIVLVAVAACVALQFAGMSQFNEVATAVANNHQALMAFLKEVPQAL